MSLQGPAPGFDRAALIPVFAAVILVENIIIEHKKAQKKTLERTDTLVPISVSWLSMGASFADVVRVNYYLPDRTEFEPCWPLLSAAFGANPPAATMVEAVLIDPKYRIEIEVTALAPK